MITGRSSTGAVHIPEVGVLVVGGLKRDKSWEHLATTELLWNESHNGEIIRGWKQLFPMIKQRWDPSVVYFERRVFVVSKFESSVEMLPISSSHIGQWTVIHGCDTPRKSPSCMCVHNGRLLLAGKLK